MSTSLPPATRFPAWLGNLFSILLLVLVALFFLHLHNGPWWLASPRRSHWWAAAAVLLAYTGLCAAIWWRGRPRRQAAATTAQDGEPPLLVAWASQTGFAEELAERSAGSLRDAGVAADLVELSQLTIERLSTARRALFVVSTTGEGDPPDRALEFAAGIMATPRSLPDLAYAVLALGDREYSNYCGFGHAIDTWLRASDASLLFDLVEVDNGDRGALRHWQHHLSLLIDKPELADWVSPTYQPWILAGRDRVNPGSAGGPVFHLRLQPAQGDNAANWQAGDIAEIRPGNADAAVDACIASNRLDREARVVAEGGIATLADVLRYRQLPPHASNAGTDAQALVDALPQLPHREYSIASIPADGAIELLVRLMTHPNGSAGLGSGWLCSHAAIGERIGLRIRSNSNFHPPESGQPMILIGNGTGVAGLRAHLKVREATGTHRNWLLLGERNAACDRLFRNDLDHWRRSGHLQRLDLAFSRDPPQPRYVQDALTEAAAELKQWVDEGAAVYVCGSLQGMAPAVDRVLRDVLGTDIVGRMLADGRYRRDVY